MKTTDQIDILPLDSLGIDTRDLKPYRKPAKHFEAAVRRKLKPKFWKDREALRNLAYSIFPEVKAATIEGLKPFIELAKTCENGRDFYERAKQIKDVPEDTANWFHSRYWSMRRPFFEICDQFVSDCKAGMYKE